MRLRSARLAAADREEPRAELPMVTTRESRKRAKSKKGEPIEANDSPAGRALNAAIWPQQLLTNAQVSGPKMGRPGAEGLDSAAAEDMHMQPAESRVFKTEAADEALRMAKALLSAASTPERPFTSKDMSVAAESLLQSDCAWMNDPNQPVLPATEDTYLQHAESPVFNAEAAAEAVRMAEALLSADPTPEQPCTAKTHYTHASSQQPTYNNSLVEEEILKPSTGVSAPEEQAASFLPDSAAYQSFAAHSTSPKAIALNVPEQGGHDAIAAASEGRDMARDMQLRCEGSMKGIDRDAQNPPTSGSTDMQHTQAESLPRKSPKHRRAAGRASLALLSRRASRSGSAEAYQRGRKSGIWLGTADMQLDNIEQQWNKYKASSQRGWTLPRLDELHAKSKALETSGFTTVPSPKLRASSRSALLQAKPSNQLKRKAEEAVPAEELKKAAKTGPVISSPRRKVAVARTQHSAKAIASGAAPSKKASAGVGLGKAAVKAGTPGKAATAGSIAWAPSPSRFRRIAQENTQPAPTSRKGTGGWVK